MKVGSSTYLNRMRPLLEDLLKELLARYEYASVLAADVETKNYSVTRSGIRVEEEGLFGRRGFTARVYRNGGYAEYSANTLSREEIPGILDRFDTTLADLSSRGERCETPAPDDTPLSFVRSTDYEIDPRDLGDEEIVKRLARAREEGLASDKVLIESMVRFNYQIYHKIFLSGSRDLEQNVIGGKP